MNEELLAEKRDLKKNWTNSFLNDLEIILEKCFLMPKKKKEHFITKERLEVDIVRLLQSQKQFTSLKNVKEDIKSLAVFDKTDSCIGRIHKIDLLNETVEFENMYLQMKIKPFNELAFFNYHSIEAVVYFDKQKLHCDKFSYKDTYRFLMSEDKKEAAAKLIKTEPCKRFAFERVVPLSIKINYHKDD